MITSLIISTFASTLYLVFQFIPTVESAPTWFVDNIEPSLGIISAFNTLPVLPTILAIALLYITILSGWQVVVFSNWLYNKIRGSG